MGPSQNGQRGLPYACWKKEVSHRRAFRLEQCAKGKEELSTVFLSKREWRNGDKGR